MPTRASKLLKTLRLYHSPIILSVAFIVCALLPLTLNPQSSSSSPNLLPGQSATILADGKLLLLGGETLGGSLSSASVWDPRTGFTTPLASRLQHTRAWHTATVLPDGTIFIFGGIGANNEVVQNVELFDPTSQTFSDLSSNDLTGRARHTATLLTDGRLLIAGGVGSNNQTVGSAELWNYLDGSVSRLPALSTARQSHSATLLEDGNVLIKGGTDRHGDAFNTGDLFDPSTRKFTFIDSVTLESIVPASTPYLVASLPVHNSVDVPTDSIISLRFSKPLRPDTVNSETVTLTGLQGTERIKIVVAENGMLVFVTAEAALLPGATYTLSINGAADPNGLLLPPSGMSFTTEPSALSTQTSGVATSSTSSRPEIMDSKPEPVSETSDDWEWKRQRRNGNPYSEWEDLPRLRAAPGVTALSGQVLDLRGMPLVNVILSMKAGTGSGKQQVETDETGRFLLEDINSGQNELLIDGREARRANPDSSHSGRKENHGVFEYGLEIEEGKTNDLPFTIWLPKIDTAHAVKIPSPTTAETVITTPFIPDLELHIPRNATIYDHEKKVAREISITPIPVDRTPFPLPDFRVPAYFTIQPGGGYIYTPYRSGARLVYPNYKEDPALPDARFSFWHYKPREIGWQVYGAGTVTPDGKQVVPDAGVKIYEFTGAMINDGNTPPPEGPQCDTQNHSGGDPVDLCTGLFLVENTDLFVPDVMPHALTRTYRQKDTNSRPFGIGATHPYTIFLWSAQQFQQVDLILPDGGRIHYVRISPGGGFTDAEFEHTATPSKFYKSRIRWNTAIRGWDLTLKDGTLYHFGESAPLQYIEDRYGNRITLSRAFNTPTGNITKITAPNGRWIEFTYNSSNRITQAKDNTGRIVSYTYDGSGRLWRVTDPNNGVTEYTYDTSHRMLTVKNPRGNTVVTNQYDSNGRVMSQTLANTGTYQFVYTLNAGGHN